MAAAHTRAGKNSSKKPWKREYEDHNMEIETRQGYLEVSRREG